MTKPYLILLTTASILVSTFANASVETQLSQCASMQDKLDRLVCYDNLSASLATQTATTIPSKAETAVVTASTATVTNTVNSQATAVDMFGNVKKMM